MTNSNKLHRFSLCESTKTTKKKNKQKPQFHQIFPAIYMCVREYKAFFKQITKMLKHLCKSSV